MDKSEVRARTKRWAIAALALGVLAGLPTAGRAGPANRCNDESVSTLKLRMAPARSSYARGEVARIKVAVTREVAGYETHFATAGTRVVVSAQAGNVIMSGNGTTDDRGRALMKLRVKRLAPTGSADGFGYAWRETALGECVGEDGHVEVARLFRITR